MAASTASAVSPPAYISTTSTPPPAWILSLPFVSDEEKHLIKAARQAIRRARFLKLQRQINQLQRSTKEVKIAPAALADKLMQILRGYPLLDQSDQPVTAVHPRFLDTPPDIILSESFNYGEP